MTATLATTSNNYTQHQKDWALSLYNSGAKSHEVEAKTRVRASYVRTLAKRVSEKSEAVVSPTVSESVAHVSIETPFLETMETEKKQEETPVSTPWRISVFVALAFLIVVGHAGLVWYDMGLLWSTPGKIGGGVVFAFIVSGMILMSEKSEAIGEVRENMLWAVGSLEALAVVVHSGAFSRNGGQAYAAGMGIEYIWALSSVICLCSIGATIFYQKVIQ